MKKQFKIVTCTETFVFTLCLIHMVLGVYICPKGTYMSIGYYGGNYDTLADCKICAAGKYNAGIGGQCRNCARGMFSSTTGKSTCESCASGTYQDELGKSSCKNCPADKPLSAQGSIFGKATKAMIRKTTLQ